MPASRGVNEWSRPQFTFRASPLFRQIRLTLPTSFSILNAMPLQVPSLISLHLIAAFFAERRVNVPSLYSPVDACLLRPDRRVRARAARVAGARPRRWSSGDRSGGGVRLAICRDPGHKCGKRAPQSRRTFVFDLPASFAGATVLRAPASRNRACRVRFRFLQLRTTPRNRRHSFARTAARTACGLTQAGSGRQAACGRQYFLNSKSIPNRLAHLIVL